MKDHGNAMLAAEVLVDICVEFPGLLDGTTGVPGADLVESLTNRLKSIPMQFVADEVAEFNEE